MTLENTIICSFSNLFKSRLLKFGAFLSVFCLLYTTSIAQVEMNMFTVAPEWDKSTVCDNGKGYTPTPINAPAMSYSGKNIQSGIFEYVWEQKKDNESWIEIASSKSAVFIPACKIKSLHNSEPTAALIKYSFRIRVKDLANGKIEKVSDIYSLSLASPMKINFSILKDPNNSKNVSIKTDVIGGLKDKTFEWISLNPKIKLSDAQQHAENPQGLSQGEYQLTVDDGCGHVVQTINTLNQSSK